MIASAVREIASTRLRKARLSNTPPTMPSIAARPDGPEEGGGDGFLEIIDLPQIATDREQYAIFEIGDQRTNPLGAAAILRGLRHFDGRPTGREARRRRHFAGEMRSRLVLDEVVESACALPTLLHYVDEMSQALGLKLCP
jgi:hypothetical protein